MEPVINRVAESDIEVFNLETLIDFESVAQFDIAPFLDKGIILREKEFRQKVKDHDWSPYTGKQVALGCSTDAIIPSWAFMLVAINLDEFAASVHHGSKESMVRHLFRIALDDFDWSKYRDSIVVVKGCGSKSVPEDAYLHAARHLKKVVRKIMYGEPCSSVPLWRKQKSQDKAVAGVGAVKAKLPTSPRK